MENASLQESESLRRMLLTFVVAGGGFAGVETVGALNDFVREAVKHYPRLNEEWIHVLLVHHGSVVLPELGESLGRYAQRKLSERQVDVRLNCRVTGYSERGVELDTGEAIPIPTLIWTAGVSPAPLLTALPCRKEKGRLVVGPTLELPEFPGVWAVGDCACITDSRTGQPHPPTAQHAVREGRHVAKNVRASVRGEKKKPFAYSTLGQLAVIGRRTGVANIRGLHFSGFVAWWLWRTVYLLKLPRLEKKVRVALDWTLDLIFPRDLVQSLTLRDIESLHEHLSHLKEHLPLPPVTHLPPAPVPSAPAGGGPPAQTASPESSHPPR